MISQGHSNDNIKNFHIGQKITQKILITKVSHSWSLPSNFIELTSLQYYALPHYSRNYYSFPSSSVAERFIICANYEFFLKHEYVNVKNTIIVHLNTERNVFFRYTIVAGT